VPRGDRKESRRSFTRGWPVVPALLAVALIAGCQSPSLPDVASPRPEAPTSTPTRPATSWISPTRLEQLLRWAGAPGDELGTRASVLGVQERLGLTRTGTADSATVAALVRVTTDRGQAPAACHSPRVALCVETRLNQLLVVRLGHVLQRVDIRQGVAGSVRPGRFVVYRKAATWTSREYGSAMPDALFFDGGRAIHYSANFAGHGYSGRSYGCVNVRDRSAMARLFSTIPVGTLVVVLPEAARVG
jgi:hypothetical protein